MTTKEKDRAGGNQSARKTSICTVHYTALKRRSEALIVTLALWGWLPLCWAEFLTQKEVVNDV